MFEAHTERSAFRPNGRMIFGFVVILVGVLLLLDNMGFLYAGDYLRWWPIFLVAFGVSRLLGIGCGRSTATGVVITTVGLWLLLNALRVVHVGFWDLWPLILVLAGIGLVSGSWNRLHGRGRGSGAIEVNITAGAGEGSPASGSSQPRVHAFALLSGSEVKLVSQAFQGGDVTAILGGHNIDFTGARMAGGRAEIDLVVWWGGVQLRIPPTWTVSSETVNILGGVDDKSVAPAGTPEGTLVLRGPVIMGGVEIKN